MKGFGMTKENYEYTLQDLYVMFRQARDEFDIDKGERPGAEVVLLIEWSKMNLPYLINWEKIIARNLIRYGASTPEQFLADY
jgi:hypothetical protein